MPTGQSTYFYEDIYFLAPNPFRFGLIGQCTWYCWSKAHAKAAAYPERNLDVSNLPTCAAGSWAVTAEDNGYTVSDTPKNDCIACWTGGHVAYVETWNPSTQKVCFSEANWYSDTNPSYEIVVPANVKDVITDFVAAITDNVTVKDTTVNNQPGTDGLFKTLSLSSFVNRKSGDCLFIYLN